MNLEKHTRQVLECSDEERPEAMKELLKHIKSRLRAVRNRMLRGDPEFFEVVVHEVQEAIWELPR